MLVALGDGLSRLDQRAIIDGVAAVWRPDGSFSATIDGNEHDMRFVYCSAAACAMPNDWRCVDQQRMARVGSVDRWRSTTFLIAGYDGRLVVPSSAGVAIRFFRLMSRPPHR
uniref:Geranylgeranyl transferase type-1 subunit beta n=1 Tax=Culex pipiens TaxID=7175 RepID=A0A8D8B6H3_CULPI